jgi:hypothetical protein
MLSQKSRLANLKLAANEPHQFDSLRHNITSAVNIFKATIFKENSINESHLPPAYLFSAEATRASRITISGQTSASKCFDCVHFLHFPAGNGANTNRDNISVYHNAAFLHFMDKKLKDPFCSDGRFIAQPASSQSHECLVEIARLQGMVSTKPVDFKILNQQAENAQA